MRPSNKQNLCLAPLDTILVLYRVPTCTVHPQLPLRFSAVLSSLVTLMSAGSSFRLPWRKKRPQNDGLTTARSKQRNSHSSTGELFSKPDGRGGGEDGGGKLFVSEGSAWSCVNLASSIVENIDRCRISKLIVHFLPIILFSLHIQDMRLQRTADRHAQLGV